MLTGVARRAFTAAFVVMLGVVVLFSLFEPLAWLPGGGENAPIPTDRRTASGFEHLAAYWVLGSFGWLGLSAPGRLISFAVLLMLLGCSLEFAQLYLPGRTADLLDATANAIGAFLGVTTAALIQRAVGRLAGTTRAH